MTEFKIMFNDLKPMKRRELLEKLDTTKEIEKWDINPIAVVIKENKNGEEK